MKGTHIKRLSALLLLLAMLVSLAACGKEETPIEKTARYLQAQIPEPTCAAVGGDWLVFGLARSGLKAPQKYFDTYYKNVEDYIVSVNGVLSRKKNTEYSRVILALTAIGKNPTNVAGFNLLLPLGDFDETVRQGVNGAIFALLALDSGGYEIPEAPEAETQATRELYVGELLRRQHTRLTTAEELIASRSPEHILSLGFAIVHRGDETVTSAKGLSSGDTLRVELSDGTFDATVK